MMQNKRGQKKQGVVRPTECRAVGEQRNEESASLGEAYTGISGLFRMDG